MRYLSVRRTCFYLIIDIISMSLGKCTTCFNYKINVSKTKLNDTITRSNNYITTLIISNLYLIDNHTKVKVDIEMNSNRERMTVNIELDKIYPIPQCNFTFYVSISFYDL